MGGTGVIGDHTHRSPCRVPLPGLTEGDGGTGRIACFLVEEAGTAVDAPYHR